MKIPGSDGNDKRINGLAQADDAVTIKKKQAEGKAAANAVPGMVEHLDSVEVSGLGSFLQSELNPQAMAKERQEKIANLKKLINDGKYNPDLPAVARAFADEVSMEVMLDGGKTGNDELT